MNRRQKIIVSVTGIFLVLLILVGLTYAFFVTRIRGNENPTSISVTTANLVVEYGDGNGMLKAINHIQPGDSIEFAEVDEEGELILGQDGKPIKHTTKTFTVENKGNDTATYSLVLTDITNTLERNQDLEFTLTKNGVEVTEGLDLNHIAAGDHQILLPKVTIAKDAIDTYTLAVTYKEAGIDQSEDMNSTIEFKIDIENEKTTWNNANEGTLTYALKNASDVATTIGNTEDDYGTSYYYKGAVTNNYVNYSGMCWRIVRVQGDGTIKLVLADDEHECNNGYSLTDDKSAFLQVGNGEEDSDIALYNWVVPFLYGGTENFFDYNGSYLYNFLSKPSNSDNWISKLSNKKLLTNTSWCNDLSIVRADVYNVPNGLGGGVYISDDYFGSYDRIENNNPSLKCNFKGISDSVAKRINDSIAVLTVDEILFAKDNQTISYLTTNADGIYKYMFDDMFQDQSYGFWTMSPSMNIEGAVYPSNYSNEAYMILTNGVDIEYNPSAGSNGNIRPAIAIKSDVMLDKTIIGQNGTYTNPYEIG